MEVHVVFFMVAIRYIINNFFFFLGYIGSGINALPKPLTAKEEKMYFDLYKSGDEDAKDILIERNMRLVVHIVKKYSMQWNDNDDLISIGAIGLIKAVTTYDSDKGHRFATYAAKCVQNEILMFLRSSKRTQSEISIDEPIGRDKEGNSISLIDILETNDGEISETVETKIKIKELKEIMKETLTNRENIIVKMRYGIDGYKEKTQKEIADELGISRSYVSRIEKKALEKINLRMSNKV